VPVGNPVSEAAVHALTCPCDHRYPEMSNLIRVLLAILLPPVGVFLTVGFGGAFWLNILLTILGYIPGIVHAVWIIARHSR
jgi:uncharacterized membrane protein YqaE (UPF0057 family)